MEDQDPRDRAHEDGLLLHEKLTRIVSTMCIIFTCLSSVSYMYFDRPPENEPASLISLLLGLCFMIVGSKNFAELRHIKTIKRLRALESSVTPSQLTLPLDKAQ